MLFWKRWILKTPLLSRVAPFLGVRGEIAEVNGGDIWYECFGDKSKPTFLLLMGAGCQGILWTDSFCKSLALRGFFVIRFDYRDLGFSKYYNYQKDPYDFKDLAEDAVSLLQKLGIEKAHLLGISMGGAIAQLIAANNPSYVSTLTLIATSNEFGPVAAVMGGDTSSVFDLAYPRNEWINWMKELESFPKYAFKRKLRKHLEGWEILNGETLTFDTEYFVGLMKESIHRQRSFFSLFNHRRALLASPILLKKTKGKVQMPTLIVHGMRDPLFPRDHAEDLASSIEGSRCMFFEDMGHNFNCCYHEKVLDEAASLAGSVK